MFPIHGDSPTLRASDAGGLIARFLDVWARSEALCEPLEIEDYVVRTAPAAHPVSWHLGHVSWYVETHLLVCAAYGYLPYDGRYAKLFGGPCDAAVAGVMARPTVEEVIEYRFHVNRAVVDLLGRASSDDLVGLAPLFERAIRHEQCHQELLLADVKHLFATNPLRPVYQAAAPQPRASGDLPRAGDEFVDCAGGAVEIGCGGEGFCPDDECPRHRVELAPYRLGRRAVTSGQYLAFVEAGGYDDPALWLPEGWAARQACDWHAPLYWEFDRSTDRWATLTLGGPRPLEADEPVCHVSFYEADAYARFVGARLPTEFEWEAAASSAVRDGTFLESERFHPAPASPGPGLRQLFGDVWEWTSSPYRPYPDAPPAPKAGDAHFAADDPRRVVRGGSCVTPSERISTSSRRPLRPEVRLQFAGFRLAH